MPELTTQPVQDPSQGSPIVDFFSGPTAQEKLRARAYDLMQKSANNPKQQALIAQEAAAIEKGDRTTPEYQADLLRDNVRKKIWQNATSLGVDASDPGKFSDIAVSTILRHGYPGAERDAALVLQWRQMREAQIRAAQLEQAKIDALKEGTKDQGKPYYNYVQDPQLGLVATDARRPRVVDPVTQQDITKRVTNVKYDPRNQEAISEGQAAGQVRGQRTEGMRLDLPKAAMATKLATDDIDKLANDPNLGYALGLLGAVTVPGTKQAGVVARIKQTAGRVRLAAYESLKGGGQITEVESQFAAEAGARLERAQTKEDFTSALHDLRAALTMGQKRLEAQARGAGNAEPGAKPAASGTPTTDIETRLKKYLPQGK